MDWEIRLRDSVDLSKATGDDLRRLADAVGVSWSDGTLVDADGNVHDDKLGRFRSPPTVFGNRHERRKAAAMARKKR